MTPATTLTPREWQIASHACIGASNKEIAHALIIAEGTVKVHLHNILQKLRVKNRTALAVVILRELSAARSSAQRV